MTNKLKLFIDLDNTCYPSNIAMPIMYEKMTNTKLKSHCTTTWNMYDLLPKEKLDKNVIHKMFDVEEFYNVCKVYDGCKQVLYELLPYYDIYFVSVGTEENLNIKRKWLKEQFPFVSEDNYILLNQAGKASTIDKSCCSGETSVIIDDTLSALNSATTGLKILYRHDNLYYSWQEGYKELLKQDKISYVATQWNKELKDILMSWYHYNNR